MDPNFNDLPLDLVKDMVVTFSPGDLLDFCLISKKIHQDIFLNGNFWKKKFIYDFEEYYEYYNKSVDDWKEEYKIARQQIHIIKKNELTEIDSSSGFHQKTGIKVKKFFYYRTKLFFHDFDDNLWSYAIPNPTYDCKMTFTGCDLQHEKENKLEKICQISIKKFVFCKYHGLIIDKENNIWELKLDWSSLSIFSDKSSFLRIPDFKAQDIACGDNSSLIIDLNNDIYGWGSNYIGQLGFGESKNICIPTKISGIKARSISSCSDCLMIIDLNKEVWVSGSNYIGQLGIKKDDHIIYYPEKIPNIKAKKIFSYNSKSFIIDLEDNVWVCGLNENCQLGFPPNFNIYNFIKLPKIKAKFITEITNLHKYHTIIIDLDDNVWILKKDKNTYINKIDMKSKSFFNDIFHFV